MNPTELPDLSKPTFFEIKPRTKHNLEVEIVELTRTSLTTIEFWDSRHSQLATPTVFHAESESAVRIDRIQRPGTKI